jgi:hypothetical protein
MAKEWWAPAVVARHANAADKAPMSGRRFMMEVLDCAQDPYDDNAKVLLKV